jgi:hypothetical protein
MSRRIFQALTDLACIALLRIYAVLAWLAGLSPDLE